MENVIDILVAAGWTPDGHTDSETVRVPTTRAPVFGGIGGELRTFGGRRRFAKPGTDRRVTVGPRTTCFYRVVNKSATGFKSFSTTKDVSAITDAALTPPSESKEGA